VNDHKAISDFRYAKTPEEIQENVQMNAYGQFVFFNDTELKEVALGHTYLRKRGKAKVLQPEPQVVTRQHVAQRWNGYIGLVREMDALAKDPPQDPKEVECDTNHCGDYGGCFFRKECGVIPSLFNFGKAQPKDKENKIMSSFAEKLAAKKAANGAPPLASGPKSIPAPPMGPHTEEVVTAPATELAPIVCQTCKGKKYIKEGADTGWIVCVDCNGRPAVTASPIIPPDASPRTSTPAEIEAMNALPPPKEKKPRAKKEKPAILASAEADTTAPVPAPTSPTPSLGEKLATKAEATAPARLVKAARKCPAKAPTIYVDVLPLKGTVRPILLEEWLAPIVETLSESMGLPDYDMDFANKAKGALHSAICECLDTLPEHIFVKSSYRGANVFLEAVIPHAAQIYQRVG
jgi:hypothetical protein